MNFSHLHLHTNYSLLNGVCKINDLADVLKKIDQKAAAITDHGNLFGAVSFYNTLKKNGIKPIVGCELYFNFNYNKNSKIFLEENISHLTVLCENKKGYENLVKIVSYSNLKTFNKIPLVSFEFLKKHKEGLIVLSGCKKGEIPKQILKGNFKFAKELALKFKEEFKQDNFFLEIQDHGEKEEKIIKKGLLKIAEQTGLFVVATNNVHYIKKEDKFVKDVLTCIKNFKTLENLNYLNSSLAEQYLKNSSEMEAVFKDCKNALKNTEEIAKRCEFGFEKFKVSIPKYENNENISNEKFLKEKAKEGLFLKYKQPIEKKVLKRFFYELEIIVKMGFVDYFLIVYDYVNYAKKKGIFVGPGRGSGAGSLISYCLDITEVNPIEFDLSFERFLNIYRTKMPDFDVDFCNERRNEVIEYVVKKYGNFRVAKIVTFGTLAYKAALRDVGRVLNMPYDFVDLIVKKLSKKPAVSLKECLNDSLELQQMVRKNEKVKLLFDVSKKVEGLLKNTSTHAAAVVITKTELYNYLPLFKNEEGLIVSQYDMNSVEWLNLLKMDFLGLRNLTILSKCEQLIKKKVKNFKIKLNDKKTFEMLSRGDSVGVFQLESFGMQTALKKIKPVCLKELMDVISLNRPGPSQFIDLYVKNKKDPEKINYLNESMKKILEKSYGVIIYQEQVIKIFEKIAGYSLKGLDKIRKIISKKELELMKKEEQYFLYGKTDEEENCCGALKKGIEEKTAKEIFNKILKFSLYSFNKSHAAAYSIISYNTAFLKCHFLLEFMVSVLNSVILNKDKLKTYLKECEEKSIKILPVDLNKSDVFFKIEGENSIRFAFLATKGVSKNFSEIIVKEREKNKFSSFREFMFRIFENSSKKEINKAVILSLVEKDAFSQIEKKEEIIKNFEVVLNDVRFKNNEIKGQLDFFKLNSLKEDEKKKSENCFLKLKVKFLEAELKKLKTGKQIFVLKVEMLKKRLNVFSSFELFNEFSRVLKRGTFLKLLVKKTKKNDKTFLILKELNK